MSTPKTKQQLQDEIERLRKRVAELKIDNADIESKLKASQAGEAEYRVLFDDADYPVIRLDREGVILQINRAGAAVANMTPAEMVGRSIYDIAPDADEAVRERLNHAFETGQVKRYEVKVDTATGQHWLTTCYVPVSDTDGSICNILTLSYNITDLKQAEEQQHLLSSIVKQSSEGVALVDMDVKIQYVNDAFARMHGYEASELAGQHVEVFHTEEQMPAVLASIEHLRATGEFHGELWHRHRDGRVFPTIMHHSMLVDDAGVPYGMVGTARDITDQKLAEAELRESHERYRLLIDNIGCPIRLWDLRGVLLLTNADGARMFGGVPTDFIGKSMHEIMPDMADRFMRRHARVIKNGRGEEYLDQVDTPQGRRWIWSNGQPARKTDGTIYGVQVIVRDVTKLKESELSLRAVSEELEAERKTLHEKNIALKQVLDHMDSQKQDWAQKLQASLERAISPFIDNLAQVAGSDRASELENLRGTLGAILATDSDEFARRFATLSTRETEVSMVIAKGKSSKEIAENMNLSLLTILKHREKIRKKLELTGKRVDLGAYLRRHLDLPHT